MNRFKTHRQENFTTIDNTIFKDKGISLKAKGLLCMVYSLPPSWDFSIEGMKVVLKEGETAIRGALKELESSGYVTRRRYRSDQGSFEGIEYNFFERPQSETPRLETPRLENQQVGNQGQLSTDLNKGLNELNKEDAPEKNLLGEKVIKGKHLFANSPYADLKIFKRKLTKESELGIDLEYYFHTVKDWSAAKGAMRNDWAAVARQFMRGDSKKQQLQMITDKSSTGAGSDQAAIDFLNMG